MNVQETPLLVAGPTPSFLQCFVYVWMSQSERATTGGTSPRFWYATPPLPPPPSLPEGARNYFFFITLAHFLRFAPQHYP